MKNLLKKLYRPGDLWVISGILLFWGGLELAIHEHNGWIFGLGVLALVIGGAKYSLNGDND